MDIDSWMKYNRLRPNPAKTEFLWLATPRRLHYFNGSSFILGNIIVKPTTISKNLGVMMNQDFSVRSHINKLIQSCFYSLRQIRSIRRSLTFDATRKLICSLIHSRVDNCNSIFFWTTGTLYRPSVIDHQCFRPTGIRSAYVRSHNAGTP